MNSDTYIQKVLGLFVRNVVPRLFPAEWKSSMVFHQDSASYHTSILTIQYLDEADINYVSPEEWRPKSPDTAPMVNRFYGILTRELQKKPIRTLANLNRILKMAWNDPTKNIIDRARRSKPKRCILIYH